MMASMAKEITARTSDHKVVVVKKELILLSPTLQRMIEDVKADICIDLTSIDSKILSKVIEFCEKHVTSPVTGEAATNNELKSFDADFVKVDAETLCQILGAAMYLNIKRLVNLCADTAADLIRGKPVEEIRETFNVVNDFTPEEEAAIRNMNPWAFR